MRRILAGFGLLMAVLIAIEAAALHWGWQMYQTWRLVPRVSFVALPALPKGAYDAPTMWLARPDIGNDPAQFLPLGISRRRGGIAYVFFLHPFTFMGRNSWNAPLDHADSRMRAALAVRSMASAFNDEAAVYAPRYRQASIGTFLIDRPESQKALLLAQGDARTAFATFLVRIPDAAPIVLAGHSEGALILLRLLRDTVRATPLATRIVAVYLAGWPVSPRHDLAPIGMAACARAGQTGCVMAWTTFADPPDPREVMAMAAHYRALDGTYADDAPLCTNPLTGGQGPAAPDSANLGSLATGDELRRPALVLPSVGARCDHGLLIVAHPPRLGEDVKPGNDYSAYDFALFWRNLRGDVAMREAAWAHEHRAS